MGPGIRLGNTGVSSTHQLKGFLFFFFLSLYENGLIVKLKNW